jgi:hypothetical protein
MGQASRGCPRVQPTQPAPTALPIPLALIAGLEALEGEREVLMRVAELLAHIERGHPNAVEDGVAS